MSGKHITVLFMALGLLLAACNNRADKAVQQIDDLLVTLWPAEEPGGAVLLLKGDRVLLKKDTDWQQQTPSHKLHLKHSFVLPLFPSSLPPLPHCVWQKKGNCHWKILSQSFSLILRQSFSTT